MKTIERARTYQASPEQVFDCIDDLGVTGMHMSKSSIPMWGGKMNLEFLTENKTGLNTKYRWTGKVLWMTLGFTVMVTKWIRGKEKSWETEGVTKMIIMSWFKMDLKIKKEGEQSTAHLSVSYEKPKRFFNRVLCFLLTDWYCRWCLKNMLNDAGKKLKTTAFIPSMA